MPLDDVIKVKMPASPDFVDDVSLDDLVWVWDVSTGTLRKSKISDLPVSTGGGGGGGTETIVSVPSPFTVFDGSDNYFWDDETNTVIIRDERILNKTMYPVATTQAGGGEFFKDRLVYILVDPDDDTKGRLEIKDFKLDDASHITITCPGDKDTSGDTVYTQLLDDVALLKQMAAPFKPTALGPNGGKVWWPAAAGDIPIGWQECDSMRGYYPVHIDPSDDDFKLEAGRTVGSKLSKLTSTDQLPKFRLFTVVDEMWTGNDHPSTIGRALTTLRAKLRYWFKTDAIGKEAYEFMGASDDVTTLSHLGVEPTVSPTSAIGKDVPDGFKSIPPSYKGLWIELLAFKFINMTKIDFNRTKDGTSRVVDSNLKVEKYLSLPVFDDENPPDINNNPDEDGAIGMKDGTLVIYTGGEWVSFDDLYAKLAQINLPHGQKIITEDGYGIGFYIYNNITSSQVETFALGSAEAGYHNWMRDDLTIRDDGVNAYASNASLSLISTTKGFAMPRMTQLQRGTMPVGNVFAGVQVYQTDGTEGIYLDKSTGWDRVITAEEVIGPVLTTISPSTVDNVRSDASSTIKLANGNLLMVYGKSNSSSGDTASNQMYYRLSSDKGKTWGDEILFIAQIEHACGAPSLMIKSNGNILCLFFVRLTSSIIPGRLYRAEFTPDLVMVGTPTDITPTGLGGLDYYPVMSDRLFIDTVNNKWLYPYPHLLSGTGNSGASVYEGRLLVSSDEGTTWADGGLSIGSTVLFTYNGFGGCTEPGLYYTPTKGLNYYFRTLVGSVYNAPLTYSGGVYTSGAETALFSGANATASIKYWPAKQLLIGVRTRVDQLSFAVNSGLNYLDMIYSSEYSPAWFEGPKVDAITSAQILEPMLFIDPANDYLLVNYSKTDGTGFSLYSKRYPQLLIKNSENTISTVSGLAYDINRKLYNGSQIQFFPGGGGYTARFTRPNGGSFMTFAASTTGAIQIVCPTNTDIIETIRGHVVQFGTNKSFGFEISLRGSTINGYTTAMIFGADPSVNFTIRFYTNGTTPTIYIGELTSIWGYMSVSIDEVIASRVASLANIGSGWGISIVTAFTGTLATTVTNPFPMAQAVEAVSTATDANYTVTTANQLVKLPVITAARTVTLPSAAANTGRAIRIWNQNTSGTFLWTFATTVKDATSTTITAIANTAFTVIQSDGTNWVKIN